MRPILCMNYPQQDSLTHLSQATPCLKLITIQSFAYFASQLNYTTTSEQFPER